ncbi:uncharacterized protein [Haliotis cracherodii]|uniref:uncharacterized protein n=1 Tax=Haliotis cracherodii TaxID=6455 RepID=UPI0039ED1665
MAPYAITVSAEDPSQAGGLGSISAVCPMTFYTKMGLAQHTRHRHPALRNKQRQEGRSVEKFRRKRVRQEADPRKQKWTSREVMILDKYEQVYHGCKQINTLIAKKLNGRTPKQISSKRATLRKSRGTNVDRTRNRSGFTVGDFSLAMDSSPEPLAGEGGIEGTPSEITDDQRREQFRLYYEKVKDTMSDNPHGNRAVALLQNCLDGHTSVGDYDDMLVQLGRMTNRAEKQRKKRQNIGHRKTKRGRSRGKAAEYRRVQQLWAFDRSRLVSEILDGKLDTTCPVTIGEIETVYKERFEGSDREVNLADYPVPSMLIDNSNILKPIEPREMLSAMSKMKADTAAGPDGIRLGALKKLDKTGGG